jgi:hypothetical protein
MSSKSTCVVGIDVPGSALLNWATSPCRSHDLERVALDVVKIEGAVGLRVSTNLIRSVGIRAPTVGQIEVCLVRAWRRASRRVGSTVGPSGCSLPFVLGAEPQAPSGCRSELEDVRWRHRKDGEPSPSLLYIPRSSPIDKTVCRPRPVFRRAPIIEDNAPPVSSRALNGDAPGKRGQTWNEFGAKVRRKLADALEPLPKRELVPSNEETGGPHWMKWRRI